jgi:hypothetical protein
MENYTVTNLDWFYLISNFVVALLCYGQSLVNLVQKKVSRFSIDALAFWLVISFGSERTKQRAIEYKNNPKRILLIGIYAILLASGCSYNIIYWIQTHFV